MAAAQLAPLAAAKGGEAVMKPLGAIWTALRTPVYARETTSTRRTKAGKIVTTTAATTVPAWLIALPLVLAEVEALSGTWAASPNGGGLTSQLLGEMTPAGILTLQPGLTLLRYGLGQLPSLPSIGPGSPPPLP